MIQNFNDVLFIFAIIGIVSFVIYLVVRDNNKKAKREEEKSIIFNNNGQKKQICYWCKQEINVGAKICPYCKKVPTKTGRDNRQIEIFIAILLIIIAFAILF